jgi:hypothetical protein
LVVEQSFFCNFFIVIPSGNSAELKMEALASRRDHLAIWHLHRPFHRPRKVSDRARTISLEEKNLVRSVYQMVIWKGFEEFDRFQVMVMAAPRRFGLTRPVNRDILSMTFSESFPEAASRTRIPSVVQSLHQIRKIL